MLIYLLSRSASLYSTNRIYLEGTRLKHNVRIINYLECDLILENGKYSIIYEHEELLKPDYVIPRIGSSVTSYGCTVVNHFEQMGVPVLNSSDSIINSRDKFNSLQILASKGIKVPKTYTSYDLYYAERVVRNNLGYPFILKVIEGTHGEGVFLVKDKEHAEQLFEEYNRKKTRVILQEFIADFSGKDLRIIVVGNQIVASMMRIAAEGDFRSNIHRGGSGEIVALSEQEKEMAIKAVAELGLHVAGVDILRSGSGSMIIEINSSPGLEGIEGVTQKNVAKSIIDYIDKKLNENS